MSPHINRPTSWLKHIQPEKKMTSLDAAHEAYRSAFTRNCASPWLSDIKPIFERLDEELTALKNQFPSIPDKQRFCDAMLSAKMAVGNIGHLEQAFAAAEDAALATFEARAPSFKR